MAITNGKNSKHSKKIRGFPKIGRTYKTSIYYGCKPLPEEFAQDLSDDLHAYFTSDDRFKEGNGLALDGFVGLYQLRWATFVDLVERHEFLKDTVENVKLLISMRRQNGMINKQYDYQSTAFLMRHYSPMWKEEQARLEDVKKELSKNNKPSDTKFIIEIPCIREDHSECTHSQ